MHFFKNLTKQQKITISSIGIILLAAIIFSIFTLIFRSGKIATTIQYAPYSATITVNGQKVPNKTTQYLEPGEYTVQVEAEHFETFSNTVTISKDYHYLVGILTPSDNEGDAYKISHQVEFAQTEGLVGLALNAEGTIRKQNFPILDYLPINNSLYSISYEYDTDNTTPIISIKASALHLDDAVAKLKTFKNVDLVSHTITFKTENPFAFYDNTATGNTPSECAKNAFHTPDNYQTTTGQDLTDNYYALKFYIDDYELDYKYSHYIALFHRGEDGLWKTVAAPQPFLTTENTPNTPKDILNTANSL